MAKTKIKYIIEVANVPSAEAVIRLNTVVADLINKDQAQDEERELDEKMFAEE